MEPSATDWQAQVIKDAADDEAARHARFKEGWQAYRGDLPLPLKPKATGNTGRRRSPTFDPTATTATSGPDDNVLVGWAGEIVDTGVDWLFKDDIGIEVGAVIEGTNPAEEWLHAVWAANRKMTTLMKFGLNAGVCGHGFIRIVPTITIEQAPNAISYQANPDKVRLVVLDPANVSVRWADDDVERAIRYTTSYKCLDAANKPMMRREVIEADDDLYDEDGALVRQGGLSWTITKQIMRAGDSDWQLDGEPMSWPFSWAPIVDCQNLPLPNEYWGLSDLDEVVIRLNKAANARASDVARSERMHAHPQPWASNMTPEQALMVTLGIDRLIALPNKDSELHLLEVQSEASTSIEFLRWLKEEVRDKARVPGVASGRLEKGGEMTGVALAILFLPLLSKTATKRRTFGDMLVDLCQRLLELGGHGARIPVTLRWPELLPHNVKEEIESALGKKTLGVSADTLLQELGYDPDEEKAKSHLAADDARRAFNAGVTIEGEDG